MESKAIHKFSTARVVGSPNPRIVHGSTVLFYCYQQNEFEAREEVQDLWVINSMFLRHFPCLLSCISFHLNCSKVNDNHFMAKANDISLIHLILIFLLPLTLLPNYSLDFSFFSVQLPQFYNIFSFLPFLPFLLSPFLASGLPSNPGHLSSLSLFYLHIYHHENTDQPKNNF